MIISDLHPDVVSHYLNENPEFLDQYVCTNVALDRVEKWAYRKRQQRHATRTHLTDFPTNGEFCILDKIYYDVHLLFTQVDI